ncbi:hypothetical protein [Streptomyces sp. BA2]|uniref:hypothetical protein n=1 Tax=Streptomyces sp. BA2 TaxID=436595 RepID=UPI001921F30F|nr:hypothetical protein [Streptomyces sp. BA2]
MLPLVPLTACADPLFFHSPCPIDDGQVVGLPLQAIVDRNGQRITLRYTPDGTPVEVAHSGGYRIAIDHHRDLPRISGLRLLDPKHPEPPRRFRPVASFSYAGGVAALGRAYRRRGSSYL